MPQNEDLELRCECRRTAILPEVVRAVAQRVAVVRAGSQRHLVRVRLGGSDRHLRRERSRLHRNEILQVNMRSKALAEIYTLRSFAPLCNLNFLSKCATKRFRIFANH